MTSTSVPGGPGATRSPGSAGVPGASGVPLPRSQRASALQVDFDHSFSRPPPVSEELLDLLALRIGGEPCTIQLHDIAEVVARPALTAVPGLVPALLGLTVSRAHVVAAYDLSTLLGGPASEPAWMLVPVSEPGVGLTFADFDGFRQIRPAQAGTSRLITLGAVVAAIRALRPAAQAGPAEESAAPQIGTHRVSGVATSPVPFAQTGDAP